MVNKILFLVRKLESAGRIVPGAAAGKKGSGCFKIAAPVKDIKTVGAAPAKKQVSLVVPWFVG